MRPARYRYPCTTATILVEIQISGCRRALRPAPPGLQCPESTGSRSTRPRRTDLPTPAATRWRQTRRTTQRCCGLTHKLPRHAPSRPLEERDAETAIGSPPREVHAETL